MHTLFIEFFFFSKILRTLVFLFYMIKKNVIAKTSVNTYAEIGLICLVPLLHLK